MCLVFVHIERGECLERVSMSELQTKNGAVGNWEHDQRQVSLFRTVVERNGGKNRVQTSSVKREG